MNDPNVNLPKDPLNGLTIEELGQKFRNRLLSCKEVTSAYYERIRILHPQLLKHNPPHNTLLQAFHRQVTQCECDN